MIGWEEEFLGFHPHFLSLSMASPQLWGPALEAAEISFPVDQMKIAMMASPTDGELPSQGMSP